MSKCDISIRFDREDRAYFGGEPVTGRVNIHMTQDVNCNGIKLTHHWRTHGRGNVHVGPKETIELAPAGPLVVGQTLDLPFSLATVTHPVTYRGHLINVDHYVGIEVSVPWAFNPKAEEEYILKAGDPPEQFVGSRSEPISLAAKPTKMGLIGSLIIWPLVVVFVIIVSVFAIFLLPIILIVGVFFWLRRRAIAARLGDVQLTIPHVIVAPGSDWNFRLQFHPQKQFAINGIYLTLLGKESATSGSGTKSTTSVHTVLEHKATVRAAEILDAGVAVDEKFSLVFPETTAYSLDQIDNKIEWTAKIRIDIPYFPDWTKTQTLQVVPAEFLKNLSQSLGTGTDTEKRNVIDSPKSVAALPSNPVIQQTRDSFDSEAGVAVALNELPPSSLDEVIAKIASVARHGTARASIIATVTGREFRATMIVDRVNSTIGVTNSIPGYEDGKTVVGTIQGTDQSIEVITPRSTNDEIDDLRRGDSWQLLICIDGWDNLYNRIKARQVDDQG